MLLKKKRSTRLRSFVLIAVISGFTRRDARAGPHVQLLEEGGFLRQNAKPTGYHLHVRSMATFSARINVASD